MDIQGYKILLDLQKTNNITRTAEKFGYSQPGISHVLKNIEREFGFQLINREKYGVTLTQEAIQLMPLIQDLVDCNEKLEETVYSIKGLEYGKVTLATYSSIAVHLLPKLLMEFKSKHPNIIIDIREGGAKEILEWIDSNAVDFAFMSKPYDRKIQFYSFGKDPLVAVLPKGYSVDDKEEFAIELFDGKPFILSADGNDFDVHHALDTSGVKPFYNYYVLDDRTILSMVENKLGLSILSELICKRTNNDVEILPLEPEYYRDMGIALKNFNKLSPAAQKFVDFANEKMPQIFFDA
ncbi:MAG: LysR family transcriptional regulator [Butyrivibrio sp.]|nr:LysR family transcriptional regulator [Butyrivibrio sp.]